MKTDWDNRISIHILTRERHDYLAMLLHSLHEQTFTNFDVYILDNNDDNFDITKYQPTHLFARALMNKKIMVNILKPRDKNLIKNIGLSRNILIEADQNKYGLRIDDDSICDRNYIEELWYVMSGRYFEEIGESIPNLGAVSGVVPVYGSNVYKYPPKVFNCIRQTDVPERYRSIFPKSFPYWNIGEPVDDGGYLFNPNAIIPAHHLRSSFLFKNSIMRRIGMHPSSDDTGFREETITSLKMIDAGYSLYTNTAAICWHMWAPNLGRSGSPEEHTKKIMENEYNFQMQYGGMMKRLFGGKNGI